MAASLNSRRLPNLRWRQRTARRTPIHSSTTSSAAATSTFSPNNQA